MPRRTRCFRSASATGLLMVLWACTSAHAAPLDLHAQAIAVAERIGVQQTFDTIVRRELEVGGTGSPAQMALKKCGDAMAAQLDSDAVDAAWQAEGRLWIEGYAATIQDLADPKIVAAAGQYSDADLGDKVFAGADSGMVQDDLGQRLNPLILQSLLITAKSMSDGMKQKCHP